MRERERIALLYWCIIGELDGGVDEASSHSSVILACPSHIFAYPKFVLAIGPAEAALPTIDLF